MKYRVKVEYYKDGSIKYYPQCYKGWFNGWKSIKKDSAHLYGDLCRYADNISTDLKSIALCEKGKNIVLEITYEYINK
jgi:hypothetical protein